MHFPVSFWIKGGGAGIGLLLAFVSCTSVSTGPLPDYAKENPALANQLLLKEGAAQLKDGDLVLRTGRDFISLALRQFSLVNKTYSHCGLVRVEKGRVWIYHAIGGEDNPQATLRRESFAEFCNPKYNLGFGIFRYALTKKEKRKVDSLTGLYFRKKVPFDMQFDLKTDSSFYCAEFVYKVLEQATGKDYLPVTTIGQFRYVAIDNLFLNPHTAPVFQAKFR